MDSLGTAARKGTTTMLYLWRTILTTVSYWYPEKGSLLIKINPLWMPRSQCLKSPKISFNNNFLLCNSNKTNFYHLISLTKSRKLITTFQRRLNYALVWILTQMRSLPSIKIWAANIKLPRDRWVKISLRNSLTLHSPFLTWIIVPLITLVEML